MARALRTMGTLALLVAEATLSSSALFSSFPVNAQGTGPVCSASLIDAADPVKINDRWAADLSFDVIKTQEADPSAPGSGHRLNRYFIVGDRLELTGSEFPSLLRKLEDPNTQVSSIVFEGREILVDMPLVFDTAHVELRAERIEFGPHGRISFGKEPRIGGDGVTILATC